MTIEFQCSACSKVLRVKDELAGKKAKCPDCQSPLRIPSTSVAAPTPASSPAAPKIQVGPPAAVPKAKLAQPKLPKIALRGADAAGASKSTPNIEVPDFGNSVPAVPEAPDTNPFAPIQTENPRASTHSTTNTRGTLVLRRVDIGSCAFMMGAYGAMCGLLVGVPFGLFTILGGALSMGSNNGVQAGGVGLIGGLFFMLLAPVVYGVFGLLGGAISGLFYNLAARFAGGLKFKTG